MTDTGTSWIALQSMVNLTILVVAAGSWFDSPFNIEFKRVGMFIFMLVFIYDRYNCS